MSEILLKIENLNKSFGITHANININLTLKKGEVRGLAGENGSGKSTLLSQIAGIYESDSGEMFIHGKPYAPKSPIQANEQKVAMVVQGAWADFHTSGECEYLSGGKTKPFISLKKLQAEAEYCGPARWELPKLNLETAGRRHEY